MQMLSKRLLIINSVCGTGSTGRIAATIAAEYEAKGWEVRFAHGRDGYVPENCKKWAVRIGNKFSVRVHGLLTRFFDLHGTWLCSYFETKRFLKWAEDWKPDVVWLHNIHGYYINYVLLFKWLKIHPEIEVKWTLHDAWVLTGHCSGLLRSNCQKWQTGCHHCKEKNEYPKSILFCRSESNWKRKEAAFAGIKNLTLITPSKWLADLTRKSFLKDYPVEVVNNTIDTKVFKPTPSDFRERFGLQDKVVILGVASTWDDRKGLQDFIKLRTLLDDKYVIVLVGLTQAQIKTLPKRMIGIARTNSAKELAEIYTASDCFLNPTVGENYPTVNLEAKACGCNIATYDTGGSSETVAGYSKAKVLSGLDKSVAGLKAYVINLTSISGGGAIIAITQTNNVNELTEIYGACDWFFNPTQEDNYPTVNLEAKACGCRVVTYDTGGASETVEGYGKAWVLRGNDKSPEGLLGVLWSCRSL